MHTTCFWNNLNYLYVQSQQLGELNKVCGSQITKGSKQNCILPGIGDLRRLWLSCLGHLVFLLPKIFRLFGFQIFWLWAYLMKAIPETVIELRPPITKLFFISSFTWFSLKKNLFHPQNTLFRKSVICIFCVCC